MKSPIKYKHLWAWDTMMGSYDYWKEDQQKLAEKENAPEDAIYRKQAGTWATYRGIESDQTRKRIDGIVNEL